MYRRRFKLSKTAAREWAERMREQEETHDFISNTAALRKGCKITFCRKSDSAVIAGEIVRHSYGDKTGQHTFTILSNDGIKHLVKGRNLYDRLIKHEPGEESINCV